MDLENNIKICFISDNKYALATAVAITSILENRAENSMYRISILGVGLSDENQQMLLALASEKLLVEIINLEENKDFSKLKKENMHVSTAALYKFILADVFKDDDKILYLDGDIIVQKDLQELFNTDIDGCYAAVVKDLKAMTYKPPQIIKLGLSHTAYFNSGVILFNLKKLRADGLTKKLIDYRKNGLNFFMDQDTFNVVFEEKVKYISFLNNVILSDLGAFDICSLNMYYELSALSVEAILAEGTIVHFASPYKPWDYAGVPLEKLWITYYDRFIDISNMDKGIIKSRSKLNEQAKNSTFSKLVYQKKAIDFNIELPVIVSLTTIPKRIDVVHNVIRAMLTQTVNVDKVVLYLSKSDFSDDGVDLPQSLKNCLGDKFEICFCDDIGPHTKYFYAMQKYPESIIITVDDDILYPIDVVEVLLNSYVKFPYAVSARRAHLIKFDEEGHLLPYRQWKGEYRGVNQISMALFATGVGGVLYPPHCMDAELFNLDNIRKLCFKADDLWLKVMQIISNTPVALASPSIKLQFIDNTQKDGLCNTNVSEGFNDIQLANIFEKYNEYFGEKDTLLGRLKFSCKNFSEVYPDIYKNISISNRHNDDAAIKRMANELLCLKNSRSYRVGRMITFLPRKIRNGIRCYKEHGIAYTLNRIKQKTYDLFKR